MHRGGLRGSYDGGKIAGLYDLEETLGRGHFAVVKLARHVFTGEKVAVKVIDKTKLDEVSRAHLFQEVRCMKLVQHPNVVRLYEVIDTHSKLYLILELADGGDLYDYIMRHEAGLSELVAQEYFAQIVRAISYCHRLHVVHRDLKPENVVFFERIGVVKLTDFGFSNKFCPGQKLETSCGSLAYSAPEILLGDSYDAPAVDIWSLGVILYMLVCGQAPFQEANDSETLTMIMDCKYTIPNHISEDCKRLIARMLVRQPEKRATLEEIANDPWLKNTHSDNTAMPLISRQNISEEDHTIIVQKMVNGGIAAKEQILDALDKNAYNHITATYYLLAERKLRSLEPKNKFAGKQIPRVSVDSCENEGATSPTYQNNHTLLGMPRPALDIAQRTRKCSIVTEEEDEDDDDANSDSSLHSSLNRRGSRSEGKLNLAVQELRKESMSGGAANMLAESNGSAGAPVSSPRPSSKMLPAPLVSARSSPQLGLDEISEDGCSTVRSGSSTPRNFLSFEQRRSRFRKSRTASCSSSEASDEDSEGRKKRGSTKSLHRGRDPRDPGGNGGSAGGNSSQGTQEPSNEHDHSEPSGGTDNTQDSKFETSGNTGRRHCLTGRHRRRVETRLRESQSLNRITEVQESEAAQCTPVVLPAVSACSATAAGQTNATASGTATDTRPTSAGTTGSAKSSDKTAPVGKQKERSKRNALIGKCLNLQKKLCMPLLKRGGRLYKAQSCSEVRNAKDINQNLKSTLKITN
ncbi:SNF-related serine/threonine-protein kinase [Planococcus citri]|uniref:SNF-related serine/threonine-protein kinase n=1 Tax=Planococcus citri TaxID=170843 RepID=UPI0031F83A8D